MEKLCCLILAASLSLSLLSGCKSAGEDTVVTVNSSGNYIVAALVLMKEEKLLEKYLPEGYTVEWTSITTSTEIRDGMLSGSIDISAPAMSTVISSLENGIPFRILSYMSTPVYKMYTSREDIQSMDDIGPGDRVSITGFAGSMHLTLLAYCKEHFGDLDHLSSSLVVMPNSEALASLSTGSDIAAACFQFSTNLQAEADPNIHCIGDITDVADRYGVGQVCVTTEDYYQEHPEVIEAFLNAQEEAIELFYSEPDRVADILIESGIDIEKADLLEAMPDSGPAGILTAEQYDTLAQFMYEAGILKKEPKLLEGYDFYEALLENNARYE